MIMTRQDFFDLWINRVGEVKSSKTSQVISALAYVDMMPKYVTPMELINVAWFIWTYATAPNSAWKPAGNWIKAQMARMEAGYKSGAVKKVPPVEIAALMADRQVLRQLDSIAIDRQTGAVSALLEGGITRIISDYSAVDTTQVPINRGVKEVTIIDGDTIREIADQMALEALTSSAGAGLNEIFKG